MELDMEQRKSREAAAEIKKLQRQLSELRASAQSEHQLVLEYTDTINALELKIVTIRKQLEHSVCIYACNSSHFDFTYD